VNANKTLKLQEVSAFRMREQIRYFQTSGTLGDAYITALKLYNETGPIYLKHHVAGDHSYWHQDIASVLLFVPKNVETVEFVPRIDQSLPRICSHFGHPDPPEIEMTWFPTRRIGTNPLGEKDYWVVVAHSGKPEGRGRNTKLLELTFLDRLVHKLDKAVLLGTDPRYKSLSAPGLHNLVGELSLLDAMEIVSGAKGFIGPEGIMLWVALSHKVPSVGYYTSQQAVDVRVIGTPWEKYATLHRIPFTPDWMLHIPRELEPEIEQ